MYKTSLNCVQKTSYVTFFASAGKVSTAYLKVSMYSLVSFAAGPAWGAPGIARSPTQDIGLHIGTSKMHPRASSGSVWNFHLKNPAPITHIYCCEGGQELSQSPWLGWCDFSNVSVVSSNWGVPGPLGNFWLRCMGVETGNSPEIHLFN